MNTPDPRADGTTGHGPASETHGSAARGPDLHSELPGEAGRVERTLDLALRRARGALLWERIWPVLVAASLAVGVFLILSWSGAWLALPPLGRIIGVLACIALLVLALRPAFRVRVPTAREALGRLDRETKLPHRPATALSDHLASRPDDPVAVALWRAHLSRMAAQIGALRAGIPAPRLAALDPRAIRALVALGVVATFFMAPGEHWRRIAGAFDWHAATPPVPYRIDAWVTPPAYTARPPVMLPGLRSDETAAQKEEAGKGDEADPQIRAAALAVPAGSVLMVRVIGLDGTKVDLDGGLAPAPAQTANDTATPPPSGPANAQPGGQPVGHEQRFVIAGDGGARLTGPDGDSVSWRFAAVPDQPPRIAFAKDPTISGRTGLGLAYRVEDDYGVVGAQATFAPVSPTRPLYALKNAAEPPAPRPLYEPPNFALPLPALRTRNAAAQTTRDFTESPWAGARMTLTLTARDEAGQSAESEPRTILVPARSFSNPLARALIEQRRTLALDAGARPRVQAALEALAIAPERFTPDAAHYMGLRTASFRLANARNDEDLRGVADYLWEIAVRIEDGDMSDVEKQLRAAQDALQKALEQGASDQEIQKLAQDLRKAMDDFMKALAEQARRNGDTANQAPDPNTRTVRPQDLQKMLDRIEDMAKNGARDAARQMLSELQNMLNGLQAGRQQQQRQQGQSEAQQALGELGDMIRQQQKLRDRTFKQGSERGGDQDKAYGELKQNQQQLRDKLNELKQKMQQAMRGRGQPQDGKDGAEQQQGENGQQGEGRQGQGQQGEGQQGQGQGQQGQGQGGQGDPLGEAEQAMREAEGALGQGDGTGAADAQSEALQALRKGARQMAEAMQQQGPGQGTGSPSGESAERTDPLGRPMRSRDYGDDTTVKVPDEMDMQRARRVLEELRRRYGESFRPQMELDYLQRLLRDY